MNIDDVKEWFELADDDLEDAKAIKKTRPQSLRNVIYHCTQATEKYLKGFLEYNGILPDRVHNLETLLNKCSTIDNSFKSISTECEEMNDYITGIRYPKRIEVSEDIVTYFLEAVEKIRNLPVFDKIRKEIANTEDI